MSTRYYIVNGKCDFCGSETGRLLGKMSGSYRFVALAPSSIDLFTFDAFCEQIKEDGAKILDQYGEKIDADVLIEKIKKSRVNKKLDFPSRNHGFNEYYFDVSFVDFS